PPVGFRFHDVTELLAEGLGVPRRVLKGQLDFTFDGRRVGPRRREHECHELNDWSHNVLVVGFLSVAASMPALVNASRGKYLRPSSRTRLKISMTRTWKHQKLDLGQSTLRVQRLISVHE